MFYEVYLLNGTLNFLQFSLSRTSFTIYKVKLT
jgi:hypothetical protein